jgi:hypothetical protein
MRCEGIFFLRLLIKANELRLMALTLVVMLLAAATVSILVAFELMPPDKSSPDGERIVITDDDAATLGWPSATPHDNPWPAPERWDRYRKAGFWFYSVSAKDQESKGGFEYQMRLRRAGWPRPVLENKTVWWDRSNPALKGPSNTPPLQILYSQLVLDAIILGGGLWLVLFGPLTLLVICRRVSRMLWESEMVGLDTCPECGWRARE